MVASCDLMSKHINITKFLSFNRQETPKLLKDLMEKFKERTQARVQCAKQNLKITKLNLDDATKAKLSKVLNEDLDEDNVPAHSDEDISVPSDSEE